MRRKKQTAMRLSAEITTLKRKMKTFRTRSDVWRAKNAKLIGKTEQRLIGLQEVRDLLRSVVREAKRYDSGRQGYMRTKGEFVYELDYTMNYAKSLKLKLPSGCKLSEWRIL